MAVNGGPYHPYSHAKRDLTAVRYHHGRGTSYVRFEGWWSTAETRSVEWAARSIDHDHPAAVRHPGGGSAWVCLCFGVGAARCFIAHWRRRNEVVVARSSRELIERMRRLPGSPFEPFSR